MSFRSPGGAPLRGDPRLPSVIPIGIEEEVSAKSVSYSNLFRISKTEQGA